MSAQIDSDEIFIVDDDPTNSEPLSLLFHSEGFRVTKFRDGESFIGAAKERGPACVILDDFKEGRSGLEILKEIDATNYDAPIVIMSDGATISMAVEAVKRGAFDVIEKPLDPQIIVERIRELIKAWNVRRESGVRSGVQTVEFPGVERLSQREREVLAEITAAASNKEAGRRLGLSPRTIEAHRAHIMLKLGAKNTADLVRLVLNKRSAD